MYNRLFQTNTYKIQAFLTNSSDIISFDTCFELYVPDETEINLSRHLKIRCNRAFPKCKLDKHESILLKLECTGKVTISDLKKHLPTVFDYNYIKKQNSLEFVKNNSGIILESAGKIIGHEKANEMLSYYINK